VQTIRLHYLSDAEIEEYLRGQEAASGPEGAPARWEKIAEITLLANGAVGMANQLAHNPKLLDRALNGMNAFQTVLQKDIWQMLQIANIKDRDEAIDLIQIWLNLSRRALIDKLGPSNSLKIAMQNYSPADLIKLIDRLKLALSSLEANANVRITLESTVLSVI